MAGCMAGAQRSDLPSWPHGRLHGRCTNPDVALNSLVTPDNTYPRSTKGRALGLGPGELNVPDMMAEHGSGGKLGSGVLMCRRRSCVLGAQTRSAHVPPPRRRLGRPEGASAPLAAAFFADGELREREAAAAAAAGDAAACFASDAVAFFKDGVLGVPDAFCADSIALSL
eukprot:359982-Chlamydomonas_euryale.AAC.2